MDMKNRQDLLGYCTYPFLPKKASCSLEAFTKNRIHRDWLGGSLIGKILKDSFVLRSQSQKMSCSVSPKCLVFSDFHSNSQGLLWTDLFSFFKEGDHLMLSTEEADFAEEDLIKELKNIKKIVLLSVNKEQKKKFVVSNLENQKKWFQFLDKVSKAMQALGLKQVTTPSLVDCPGTEPDLDFFSVSKNKFLSSSPELPLKRLLCRGLTDVYEIKKCFRKEELGPHHHPEFYMLEWYRAYSDLNVLIEDLYFLLNFLSEKQKFPPLKEISMQELFKECIGINLEPHFSRKDLASELKKNNIPFNSSLTIDDLFYLLFLNKIEPHLEKKTPTIVYDYPPFQRAYSRVNSKGWASRFELFWQGMELANAFDEIIKPEEQARRFQEDNLKRKNKGRMPIPEANDFLKDMEKGMPPTAGIALGLERLFMVFHNLKDIKHLFI